MIDFMISQIQSQTALGLLCLVAVFFYVGLITIGGGLVAITVMQQVLVERFQIINIEMFYNMVAISESTPGPMGINMATYVGTELYGVGGGLATTFGQVLPSIICIIIIASFFSKFQEKPVVKAGFSALRPAVTGVIAVAAAQVLILALFVVMPGFDLHELSTWKQIHLLGPNTIFYLLGVTVLFKTKLHPLVVVAAGALFGVVFC